MLATSDNSLEIFTHYASVIDGVFAPPQNSCVETLTPSGMLLEGGAIGGC